MISSSTGSCTPNEASGLGRASIAFSNSSRVKPACGGRPVSIAYSVATSAQTSSEALSAAPRRRSGGQKAPMGGTISCVSTGAMGRPSGSAITLRGEIPPWTAPLECST
jgi:hypothetical protein